MTCRKYLTRWADDPADPCDAAVIRPLVMRLLVIRLLQDIRQVAANQPMKPETIKSNTNVTTSMMRRSNMEARPQRSGKVPF